MTPAQEQAIRERNGGYIHAEAYCLMEYASADGREVEYIWNSRDGVTPFVVMSRRGTELRHANWAQDRRIVDFVPQPGSRIFVDWTEEQARQHAANVAERDWHHPRHPLSQMGGTREEVAEMLFEGGWRPGQPFVQVVE